MDVNQEQDIELLCLKYLGRTPNQTLVPSRSMKDILAQDVILWSSIELNEHSAMKAKLSVTDLWAS